MYHKYGDFKDMINSVEGLLLDGEEEFLFGWAAQMPEDGVIVEIGSYLGRSSACLGLPCLGTKRKVYCIDPWGTESWFTSWKDSISRLGLSDNVIPLRGYAGDILQNWKSLTGGVEIDMLFEDASHCLPGLLNNLILSFPWIKDHGVIAVHDITHPNYPDAKSVWEIFKTLLIDQHYFGSIALGRKIGGIK
jgi:predicted O-methyltransferase YrrM